MRSRTADKSWEPVYAGGDSSRAHGPRMVRLAVMRARRETMRVLIIDDHKLFAEALRPLLEEEGMEVVDVAATGEAGLAIAERERPDLVLVDLGLPDESGLDVGRKLLEMGKVTVVALTVMDSAKFVQQAVEAGFQGYVTKDTPLSRLVKAVREAAEGRRVIPDWPSRQKTPRVPAGEEQVLLIAQLTEREREVLALLAEAASSSEIARRLGISVNTVRTHVQNILAKLQVHSRLEAMAFAVRHGLVPRNGPNGP